MQKKNLVKKMAQVRSTQIRPPRQDKRAYIICGTVIMLAVVGMLVWIPMRPHPKAVNVDTQTSKHTSSSKSADTVSSSSLSTVEPEHTSADIAPITDLTNKEPSFIPPTNTTFTSSYDGYSFTFPKDWQQSDQSGNTVNGIIIQTAGNDGSSFWIVASSNVTALSTSCGGHVMYVYDVEKLSNVTNNQGQPLYLLEYYYDTYNSNPRSGGIAVTDWNGTAPKTGASSYCGFLPTIASEHAGEHIWIGMSNGNYSVPNTISSPEQFFALPQVVEAKQILASIKMPS